MATNWPWAMATVLMTATVSPARAGAGDLGPVRPTLVVRTYDTFGVPGRDLSTAEATAARVFDGIGVRVVWMNCGSAHHHFTGVAAPCDEPLTTGEVILRIAGAGAGSGDEKDTASMGFALVSPHAGTAPVLATVFADRVLDVARGAGIDARPLLGLAIGHELGHLLLSTDAHAPIGLMRAHWSQAELRRTRPADWQFLTSDARVIQDEVTRRTVPLLAAGGCACH
jgi:hypothetical protein